MNISILIHFIFTTTIIIIIFIQIILNFIIIESSHFKFIIQLN